MAFSGDRIKMRLSSGKSAYGKTGRQPKGIPIGDWNSQIFRFITAGDCQTVDFSLRQIAAASEAIVQPFPADLRLADFFSTPINIIKSEQRYSPFATLYAAKGDLFIRRRHCFADPGLLQWHHSPLPYGYHPDGPYAPAGGACQWYASVPVKSPNPCSDPHCRRQC